MKRTPEEERIFRALAQIETPESDLSTALRRAEEPRRIRPVRPLAAAAVLCALLTIGAALVWGIYSVIVRVLGTMGYQTVPLTCRIFGYGFLFLLIPTAFEGLPAGIAAWGTPVHLANLLFLGLIASATCFVTWNRAVFLLGPVRTSVYIYASPVITIIASALVLHETMTPVMWLGTALALGGLMLSEKKPKKAEKT